MALPAPFLAGSPGALKRVEVDPRLQKLWNQAADGAEFKDIWGSTYQDFMGITDGGGDINQINDNPTDYSRAYSADAVVYRCVDIRGAAIASVPFSIYDSTDPDQRKPVDHEALGVLTATNPFSYIAGPQLLRYSLSSRDLHGHFAWQYALDKKGLPREIYWMQPEGYKAIAGKDLKPPKPKIPFGGLKMRMSGKEVVIPPEMVLYGPTHNISDPLKGMSKITALRNQINLKAYGEASNIWFFQNNQRPDLLVTGAFNPTIENVGLMRRIWAAAFGGDKSRGPAFLPHDMSVHLLTTTPKDAEWLGQQTFARESILAAFGVPPPVYGDLARATYENIRTAYENFWRTVMIAELDEISWFITQQFLWKWDDARRNKLVCAFDYSQIEALNEDANQIWERFMAFTQRISQAVAERQLTPNQSRVLMEMEAKRLGLPTEPWQGPVDGGDTFYVRIQDIPIVEASVQANIDMMAARAGDVEAVTHTAGNGSWDMPNHVVTPAIQAQIAAKPAASQSPAQQATRQRQNNKALEGADDPNTPVPTTPPLEPREIPLPVVLPPPQPLPLPDAIVVRKAHLGPTQDWLTRRFKRYFQDLQVVALRNIRASSAELALTAAETLWDRDEAREQATEIVKLGAAMAHEVAYRAAATDYKLAVSFEPNPERVVKYLGNRLHYVQNIDETTRKAIRTTLQQGTEAQETLIALAKRVRDVFASAIDQRAATIARTESVQAYGWGSLQAFKEAKVAKARVYDNLSDDCADCLEVSGREVTLDEAERLMAAEHVNGNMALGPVA